MDASSLSEGSVSSNIFSRKVILFLAFLLQRDHYLEASVQGISFSYLLFGDICILWKSLAAFPSSPGSLFLLIKSAY